MKIEPLAQATAGLPLVGANQASSTAFQAVLERARASAAADTRHDRTTATGTTTAGAQSTYDALAAELHDWLKKSPIEHMREQILKEMGLTEADIAAMPPEQQSAVEAAIAAKIRERLEAQNGVPGKGGASAGNGVSTTPELPMA